MLNWLLFSLAVSVVVMAHWGRSKPLKMAVRGAISLSWQHMFVLYRNHKRLFSLLSWFSSKRKPPPGVPLLEKTERVAGNVTRVLGLNPGPYTLQGTNTYLLGDSSSKILIDTGEKGTAKEYVSYLLDEVFPKTKTTSLSHILLTHGHEDHQGGVRELLKQLKSRNMLPLPSVHKYESPSGSFPVKDVGVHDIKNGEIFSTSGASLQALYSPGHTDEHVCFILKENKALLSGDCILGCGSAVFEELHSYMSSLKRLRKVVDEGFDWDDNGQKLPISSIYPGHGPILCSSAIEKVDEYITHREEREKQIVDHLEASVRTSSPWCSSWDIMLAIYPASLPITVKVSAQGNVQHHLSKLIVDGVVKYQWPDLWHYNHSQ